MPVSSICYAVGDRGNAMKSTDGGQTWSWLSSTDGNPIYGLSCPTTHGVLRDRHLRARDQDDGRRHDVGVADDAGHDAGLDQVAETGGPNPFAGLTGISCSDANTCAAVGLLRDRLRPDARPAATAVRLTTTDGGATWTRQAANTGTNYLAAVKCLPGHDDVLRGRPRRRGRDDDRPRHVDGEDSGTTDMLNSVYCSCTSFCIAVGQNGTVDTLQRQTWTATTGNGGTGMLADVACDGGNLVCYATGKQGVTLLTTTGGTSWTQKAGGGSQANQMNGISCTSTSVCTAVGNAGTILRTTNGGQTWLALTSGTANALNAISCPSGTTCFAAGAAGTILKTADSGATWPAQSSGTTLALNGVSCSSADRVCGRRLGGRPDDPLRRDRGRRDEHQGRKRHRLRRR